MAIPLPPEAPEGAAQALRERLGLGRQTPLLGSFGFQTPIKRTGAVVEALARPELAHVHLLVAGEVSPELDFAALSRRLGVGDRVHVLGFLPFDELEAAIAAVDLCLNLRYPTAGETSASLLRVLALGKAAIVSDYGQFAELPVEVVARTPVGEGESEALAATVSRLLEHPESLAALGASARRHVREEHDPGRAARALAAACGELADLQPPGPASAPSLPPSSLAWSDLPGTLRLEGAESPWLEGERRRLEVFLDNTGQARWLAAHRGPGGLALEARWLAAEDQRPIPWLPLTRDVDPGQSARFELELRRPLGPCRLRLAARVLDAGDERPAAARIPSLEVAV